MIVILIWFHTIPWIYKNILHPIGKDKYEISLCVSPDITARDLGVSKTKVTGGITRETE